MLASVKKHPLILGACLLASLLFFVVFSQSKVVLLPTAGHDDALFVWLGHKLASGAWLGGYTNRTLTKGIGFPLFLGINHLTGLPYTIGISLLVMGCAAFFAFVVGRLLCNVLVAAALYCAVLLAPGLFEYLRVTREVFYAGVTLAVLGAAFHVFLGNPQRRTRAAVALGVLGGVFWLTREEGIWVVPALLLLLAVRSMPLVRQRDWLALRADVLHPAGVAALTFAIALSAVGVFNFSRYGEFTTNEVKGRDFQAAMVALQKASYPDWRPFVPVPQETRWRLYEISPTFRQLRPHLDPPEGSWGHTATCRNMPKLCGDIAGGWFLWVLRDAAAQVGAHANASSAARFYRQLAGEVEGACADKRLTCADVLPPLVPPMTRDQIPDVFKSAGRALRVVAGGHTVKTQPPPSVLAADGTDLEMYVLNRPTAFGQSPDKVISLDGRFNGDPPKVVANEPNRILEWRTAASEDRVQPSNRQRYRLAVGCHGTPCKATFVSGSRQVAEIDLDAKLLPSGPLTTSDRSILTIDRIDRIVLSSMRDQIASGFLAAIPTIGMLYVGLNIGGLLAFVALLAVVAIRRTSSVFATMAGVIAVAVLGRVFVIALVDATSFPAVANAYLLPATVLTGAFSILSIAGLWATLREPLGRLARPRADLASPVSAEAEATPIPLAR
jgi:hypothetical protein